MSLEYTKRALEGENVLEWFKPEIVKRLYEGESGVYKNEEKVLGDCSDCTKDTKNDCILGTVISHSLGVDYFRLQNKMFFQVVNPRLNELNKQMLERIKNNSQYSESSLKDLIEENLRGNKDIQQDLGREMISLPLIFLFGGPTGVDNYVESLALKHELTRSLTVGYLYCRQQKGDSWRGPQESIYDRIVGQGLNINQYVELWDGLGPKNALVRFEDFLLE